MPKFEAYAHIYRALLLETSCYTLASELALASLAREKLVSFFTSIMVNCKFIAIWLDNVHFS